MGSGKTNGSSGDTIHNSMKTNGVRLYLMNQWWKTKMNQWGQTRLK